MIICPGCNCSEGTVISNHDETRTCSCDNCGAIWSMIEISADDLKILRDIVAATRQFIARVDNIT